MWNPFAKLARRGERAAAPAKSPMAEVFGRIFRDNNWNYGESVSGPGSTLLQTETIRQELPGLIESLNVRSVLDAGCGDMNWMRRLAVPLERYVGIDVVPDLIEKNRRELGSADRVFEVRDLTRDSLPRVDLVLCRDCLVHFSFEDVFRALRNVRASGSRYLLTTTFPARESNADVPTGSWRTLNYEKTPFLFPPPLALVNEKLTVAEGTYADKSLGLWEVASLPL